MPKFINTPKKTSLQRVPQAKYQVFLSSPLGHNERIKVAQLLMESKAEIHPTDILTETTAQATLTVIDLYAHTNLHFDLLSGEKLPQQFKKYISI